VYERLRAVSYLDNRITKAACIDIRTNDCGYTICVTIYDGDVFV